MSDVWVPVPTRWADVQVGALIVDDRARVWEVTHVGEDDEGLVTPDVRQIGTLKIHELNRQPDVMVNILRPQLDMLRDELGAQTG